MTNKSKNSDQEFKVPPAFKFQEGEKVLCFHGPLIYEAKCLQSRYDEEEKTNKYHIHYSGWNKSWDEWVPETRVLKFNDANIQRQKELHKAQKAEPKGKKGKKRSISGKDKEGDGKEKDADDSRSSTPVIERGGGKASASATQSSSQESASDIPKRKRSKLDPSVESKREANSEKRIRKKSNSLETSHFETPRETTKRTSCHNINGNLSNENYDVRDPKIKEDPDSSLRAQKPLENEYAICEEYRTKKLVVMLEHINLEKYKVENNSYIINNSDDLSKFGEYVVNRLRRITDYNIQKSLRDKILKILPDNA